MPNVDRATHLGIIRTASMKSNIQANVDENITKSRRSAYSLFGSGFRGTNGLDPESLLHIHVYKTYVLPILLYGMELLIPSSKPLEQLEMFQKRMIKQLLSLPTRCPDPAVYILTGILPIEAQIHLKALVFFNNVCHQDESSIEKKLAVRQLTVKAESSNSWFICINNILRKYDMKEASTYLESPMSKSKWRSVVKSKVREYWSSHIHTMSQMYSSLQFLNSKSIYKGIVHPILKHKYYSALQCTNQAQNCDRNLCIANKKNKVLSR
jgi:hypothetical protein